MTDLVAGPAGPVLAPAPAPDEPCVVPVEQRYPLDLTSRLADVRRLYEEAAGERWDPEDADLQSVGVIYH